MTAHAADCHHNGHGPHPGDDTCSCACHGALGRDADYEAGQDHAAQREADRHLTAMHHGEPVTVRTKQRATPAETRSARAARRSRPRPGRLDQGDELDRLRDIRELMHAGFTKPIPPPPSLHQMARRRAS